MNKYSADGAQLRRHSKGAIFIHWFNAVLWFTLLGSGLAMLAADLQILGNWWPEFLDYVFGAENVRHAHAVAGQIWIAVFLMYIVIYSTRDVFPFLREVFHIRLASDALWCVRKGLILTLGPKVMRRFGLNPELPPQGFYNAGQKFAAIAAVFCGLGLACTGVLLYLNLRIGFDPFFMQWCLFFHVLCASVMIVVLPIHIYMAALAPGEGPALRSMFTGKVPASFAKHHNPLWYAEAVSGTDSATGADVK